jgi:hypothetical protein
MNPYDQYPVDYTGYGPAGTGGAPTLQELQRHQRSRHMTTRMAQAAGFLDPVAQAAAMKITKGVIGGSPSPDALRRAMFNSSTGQMAQDAAMVGRASGMLGQGDPITAASNIMQGVAGGGFRTTMGGNNSYGTGPVSGNGNISEHVSMAFMKGIMQDMTGGKGDGSRTNGFNVEEVSQLFKTYAQRGGIGRIAHIQQGAGIGTRLSSAAANAVDPSLAADMKGIKLEGSEKDQIAQLEGIMNTTDNKKLKQELDNVLKAPAALIINNDEKQRVTGFMKNMTESLAGMADIYGELSAPELQQKLESISGMRITNREQLAKATAMTNQLRGAAVVSGMDPRAFMDWSGDMQAQLRGDVANVLGADGRHSGIVSGATAGTHNRLMVDSALAGKAANQAVAQGRELGLNLTDAPDMTEIYEDKRQGTMQFMERYGGVTAAQGGLQYLSGDKRKEVEGLMDKFKNTTDAEERTNLNSEIEALLGGEKGFDAFKASRTGKIMMANSQSDPANAREMERMVSEGRGDAVSMDLLNDQLSEMGIKDAEGTGKTLFKGLGLKGMGDLLRTSKTEFTLDENGKSTDRKLTGADRLTMQRNQLATAGIKGAEADKLLGQFFDKDGRVKDEEGFNKAAELVNMAGYGSTASAYDRANLGQSRLEMIGADDNRMKMTAGDKGISFNSIATAIATGDVKSNSTDPEVMALMLDSLGEANMPLVANKDGKMVAADTQYKTGINLKDGLNKENMGELSKIFGKDLNLHKKMTDPRTGKKFESEEEFMKATQGDAGKNLLADAIEVMQTDKEYLGMNLRGKVDSMSVMTDSAKDSLTNSGALEKKFKQAGGAMMLARASGLDDKYKTGLMDSLQAGKAPDLGFYSAGKHDKITEKDGVKDAKFGGESFGRMMSMSGAIGSSDAEGLAALSSLDEGGAMTGKLEEQMEALKAAKKAGATTATYKGMDGEEKSSNIDDLIKQFKATIDKLAGQQMAEAGATVTQQIIVQGDIRVTGEIAKTEKD